MIRDNGNEDNNLGINFHLPVYKIKYWKVLSLSLLKASQIYNFLVFGILEVVIITI